MLPAVAGMLLLSSFFAPPLYARFGIRKGCVLVLGAAMVLFALLPLAEDRPPLDLSDPGTEARIVRETVASEQGFLRGFPGAAAVFGRVHDRFDVRQLVRAAAVNFEPGTEAGENALDLRGAQRAAKHFVAQPNAIGVDDIVLAVICDLFDLPIKKVSLDFGSINAVRLSWQAHDPA